MGVELGVGSSKYYQVPCRVFAWSFILLGHRDSNSDKISNFFFSSINPPVLLRGALIFVAYLLVFIFLDLRALSVQVFPGIVAWYPPDGLSLAFLLTFGAPFLPAFAIASLISSLFVYHFSQPLLALIEWALIISLAYGVAVWFLRQYVHIDVQLRRPRDLFWMITAIAVIAGILATISIASMTASGVVPEARRLWASVQWWIGEMIGVLVVTPPLLIFVMPTLKRFVAREAFLRSISFPHLSRLVLTQILGIFGALYLAFNISWSNNFHPYFLIAIPLLWIAIQHGLPGASLGVFFVNFAMVRLAQWHDFNIAELGQLQLLLFVISLGCLLIGIIVSEHKRSLTTSNTAMARQRNKITYELIIVAIIAVLTWILEYTFDFVEGVTAWERRNQIRGLDETLVTISVLGIVWAVFSYRRWKEVEAETQAREKAQTELQGLYRELEARVQDRTVDLSKANESLQAEIAERRQAARALRESELRFRLLFTTSPDSILLIDPHDSSVSWSIVDCNEVACQMNGYRRQDLIGQSVNILNITEGTDEEHRIYLDRLRHEGVIHLETFHRHKDGHIFPVEVSTSLFAFEGRELVLGIDRDITERRRAEAALQKAEAKYRTLVEQLPAATYIVEYGEITNPIYVSPQIESIFGFTAEEWLADANLWVNQLHPEDREKVLAEFSLRDELNQPIDLDYRIVTRQGRIRWIHDQSVLILDERGVRFGHGLIFDITERKKVEESLERSEKRFRALVEHSLEEVSLVSADGTLLYESPTTRRSLGYSPGSFVGKDLFELLHPDERQATLKLLQQVIGEPGGYREVALRLHHQDGSWHWMEGVVHNLLDEPAVGAIVINYRDVTARREAEEALIESDQRFRDLFENSPVSIWQEDFSEVKIYLDTLKAEVQTDFESYLVDHPEVASTCAELVKILDVNQASLELQGANTKAELLENRTRIFTPKKLAGFRQELITIWNGRRRLEVDGVTQTLDGKQRDVRIIWAVAPGSETSYSRVLVSLIDITERKLAEEEIQSRNEELSTLYELSRALAEANDVDAVLDLVNQRTVESLHTTFARIALLEGGELITHSVYPIRVLDHDLFAGSRKPIASLPYCQSVFAQGEPVILYSNTTVVSDEERATLLLDLAQTLCIIPLRVHDFSSNANIVLGALMVGEVRNEEREPFTSEKLRLARSIGDQAAIAIESTRLFNDLERSNVEIIHAYDATITGWSAALDLRDKETEGHTQRVTEMTLRLAEKMGFSEQELVQVRRGALLHDIGKMGVPDRILLKPDKLTDEEWVLMRLHPTYAFQLLKPITYLRLALDIPYCHHEKWDGTGYPRQLSGEHIPIAARIFAIVDVYDALTSDRPYRAGWSKEKTLQHIRELSGSHFDPEVVEVFMDWMEGEDK
jgi:PAS domain S-box-containing protein